MKTALNRRLADRLAQLRAAEGWTLDQLAARSGVSRAALSRLENAEVSPTVDVIARLADAHGMALSQLLSQVEEAEPGHIRRDDQPSLRDEATGVRHRVLSPPAASFALHIEEITLPPDRELAQQQGSLPGQERQIVMLSGYMTAIVEDSPQALGPGDVLRFRQYGATRFVTEKGQGARFLLCISGA
ncbi:helix-turn-helix domain-containing protein [Thetidibacter halocola]|uniref:Helix-turn-helix domain-containing protein n=1 Tax=Thetidibacter halocola TaxID=2827239 RepID=A0A8J7WHM4_9RHOB|nr:helix-turn-helix domain-containing protein [Thetidibacter halocola]MBS0126599.1 helix-turn-helix domain-containing protein [Thetidibacter halocola]